MLKLTLVILITFCAALDHPREAEVRERMEFPNLIIMHAKKLVIPYISLNRVQMTFNR